MTAGSVTLTLDKRAVLTNAVLKVKDVPLFYLPAMYFPINKEDRSTGFLLPIYGTSLVRGQTLSNAFFWAVDRSQDVTLMHDWFIEDRAGLWRRVPLRRVVGVERTVAHLPPRRARDHLPARTASTSQWRRRTASTCAAGSSRRCRAASVPAAASTSPPTWRRGSATSRTSTARRRRCAATRATCRARSGRGNCGQRHLRPSAKCSTATTTRWTVGQPAACPVHAAP